MPALYQSLLKECFTEFAVREQTGKPQLDELELQSHWFSGHFGLHFTSDDGRDVCIQQLGFWNRSAGPDFLHCAVTIDDTLHTGAIELDLSPDHWKLHQHDTNPNFSEVILHVVFSGEEKQSFTRDLNNRHVTRVTISTEQVEQALSLPTVHKATAHLGRCSSPLADASIESVLCFLESTVRYRIQQKAKRSKLTLKAHGEEQGLWMQIAETLGYRPNSLNFKILAQRIPISTLIAFSELEITSILFGSVGFLHPQLHEKAPEDSRQWLEQLWTTWWQLRHDFELSSDRQIQWVLAGIRPVNHPQRRLAALAQIACHWNTIKSMESNELEGFLLEMKDSFWNHHYTLTSKRSEKHLKLIGKDRVNDLFINHLLPNKIAEGDSTAWNIYQSHKSPVISEKVSRAATRLFGEHPQQKHFLKKAWQHQALLQIYQDFCLKDVSDCENCPFPEQFQSWVDSEL